MLIASKSHQIIELWFGFGIRIRVMVRVRVSVSVMVRIRIRVWVRVKVSVMVRTALIQVIDSLKLNRGPKNSMQWQPLSIYERHSMLSIIVFFWID